jgi:hypothetical protein
MYYTYTTEKSLGGYLDTTEQSLGSFINSAEQLLGSYILLLNNHETAILLLLITIRKLN